jgi:dihydrolipoamide dehydrogenase
VLATGSTPRGLPGVDIDREVVLTSDQALWFLEAPKRAVIIGAGAIGMEFASMWHPFGTEVIVIEALDRALPLEDVDSSKAVQRAFKKKGIEVLTSTMVEKVAVGQTASGAEATVEVSVDGGSRSIEADVVLVAIGRAPNTADTGAAELGILDDRGFAVTDEYGRTSVDGVWAVGDVLPTLALAHAAFSEGFVVADVIAGERIEPVDYDLVPRVTYCHPEVASVGLTEEAARERFGDDVDTTTYNLRANARALIAGVDGHVKLVTRRGGQTLGVHIVGPHATDLIAEATMATYWEALPAEVAAITHAHPTLYEAIGEAFLAASGTPFHGH